MTRSSPPNPLAISAVSYDKRIPMRDGLELSVSGSYCGIYLHYAGKTQFVTAHTLYKLMGVSDPAYEQATEDL